MRRFATALDVLGIAVGVPALVVAVLALVNRVALPGWVAIVALASAIALVAAATPGRGRGWRLVALLCVVPAVPLLGLGLALVWFGPSADSGSWGPVIFGWGLAAYGASFVVLALVVLCHSQAVVPGGLSLAVAVVLAPLLIMENDERKLLAGGLAAIACQAIALLGTAFRLPRTPRASELAMMVLLGEACAAGWIAYFMYSDSRSTYDEDAVTIALVALACALLLGAATALSSQPLLRLLARIPVFAAASAVALLLSFDDRFPYEEAMLLLAGAALAYAYVIGHPRKRRLLPVIEIAVLPLSTLVLFTEVPGFGLAVALVATVIASEWFWAHAGRGRPHGAIG